MGKLLPPCLAAVLLLAFVSGCGTTSWPNPNIGTRTVDYLLLKKDYAKAFETLKRHSGKPWAQFRLGLLYEGGLGVRQDYPEALRWYLKAALQRGDDDWSKGKSFYGESGLYARNLDASNAQIRISRMRHAGLGAAKDDLDACLWLSCALESAKTDGASVPSGLPAELETLVKSLSEGQRLAFENAKASWTPSGSSLLKELNDLKQ